MLATAHDPAVERPVNVRPLIVCLSGFREIAGPYGPKKLHLRFLHLWSTSARERERERESGTETERQEIRGPEKSSCKVGVMLISTIVTFKGQPILCLKRNVAAKGFCGPRVYLESVKY